MTTLTEDIELPGGVDPATVTVRLELWGDGEPVTGYEQTTGKTVAGPLVVTGNPWSIANVVGNADIDAPTGTVYRATRKWPGLREALVDYLDVPNTGTVRVDQCLADEPGAIESAALATYKATANARLDSLGPYGWYETADWSRFTAVPVSTIDNTVALTVDDGLGIATGVGGPSGQDRRLYIANDLAAADVECYADLEATSGGQFGFAFRRQAGKAVIVWHNILFGATGSVLQGVWEFDGTDLPHTNQDAESASLWGPDVVSAAGNGTTVTVKTATPHLLSAGHVIHFDASFGAFGQVTVASVIDATTFTFTDATAGAWTGGRFRWVIAPGRRKLAARLVGTTITFKQWLPGQDEPAWDDPIRAVTNTLPATLAGGGPPPSGTGGVGFVIAHLGSAGAVRVTDWKVTNLDLVDSQELVAPNAVTHAALGAQVARIDELEADHLWIPAHLFTSAGGANTFVNSDTFPRWKIGSDSASGDLNTTFRVPAHWTTLALDLWVVNATAGAGDISWTVSMKTSVAGELVTKAVTTQSPTMTALGQNVIQVFTPSSFNGFAVPENGVVGLFVRRAGAAGADTKTGDEWLLGVALRQVS